MKSTITKLNSQELEKVSGGMSGIIEAGIVILGGVISFLFAKFFKEKADKELLVITGKKL